MKRGDSRKTVLVTGATSDIGRCILAKFVENGWNVIAHYNSDVKMAGELKKDAERLGVSCKLLKADFSLKKEAQGFVEEIGGYDIDGLINNAGTYISMKHFSALTIDDMIATYMVNVFVSTLLAGALFEKMKRNGFGRIVNISSIAAKYGGSSHSLHYGCSKRALEGLTKTLAREGAEHNVLVNTIRPGVIDTKFHKKFPKDMARRVSMIPVKRMGTVGDVADMAYYLGSDKNDFITNEIIAVAGGE